MGGGTCADLPGYEPIFSIDECVKAGESFRVKDKKGSSIKSQGALCADRVPCRYQKGQPHAQTGKLYTCGCNYHENWGSNLEMFGTAPDEGCSTEIGCGKRGQADNGCFCKLSSSPAPPPPSCKWTADSGNYVRCCANGDASNVQQCSGTVHKSAKQRVKDGYQCIPTRTSAWGIAIKDYPQGGMTTKPNPADTCCFTFPRGNGASRKVLANCAKERGEEPDVERRRRKAS